MIPLLLALLGVSPLAALDEKPNKKVLVFYPDSDGRSGILVFDRELRTALRDENASIEIFNEFLDVSRFPEEAYQQQLALFPRSKYATQKLDAVVVALAPALDFVLKHRSTIFPGVPVIYGAIERHEIDARQIDRDIIGYPMNFALEPTLNLAMKLHPGLNKVYVIAGNSDYDQYWLNLARSIFARYAQKLTFSYHNEFSVQELQQFVSTLPPNSMIYFLHMLRDGKGTSFSSADVVEMIAPRSSVPIYGHVGTYMGRGIVGGQLMEFEQEARNAAFITLQILRGKKPADVTLPATSLNHFVVDARMLTKWGIREVNLPADIEIRFAETDFWEKYKWHVLLAASLCIAEALLIIGLVLQMTNRQKAERLFRLSVESAPNGMVLIGHDGKILLANAQMEKLFGYTSSELIGSSMEILVPERFRNSHPLLRGEYMKSPGSRPMGIGRELHGRRKDGTEFPVEIGLNPILSETPVRILATIVDITERKAAEEQNSQNQKELIGLTGKLIQAQESERRHIARELHDDLNQNLALLAVELDLLGKKPPETRDELGQNLTHLSSQVKQLSTFVHDLSHHLHPAKVEQLGLVTSLRALARDLSIAHETVIECLAEGISKTIPHPVALCLYRIAQESLRNALKHSEADEIIVKLSEEEDTLQLMISDNGKGFAPQNDVDFSGLGLCSMRERLRLVNGTMLVDSQLGKGTIITVRVPHSQQAVSVASEHLDPVAEPAILTPHGL